MSIENDPLVTIERLVAATNGRDLEGLVSCFGEDYMLSSPNHPQRSFQGREQVRRNWTSIFAAISNIQVRVVGYLRDGETIWTEWEHEGTRPDGTQHHMSGVFIFRVHDGLIRTGRMYFEPVETTSGDMNAAVRAQVRAP